MRRGRACRLALLFAALIAAAAGARARGQAPSGSAGAADPIRCWWRTSAGAVATGEPFDASLTCAVQDDAAASVVVDETRLGALAIQLGVFEVLGGSHPADLRTPTHRFFQYHYTVRVIDRDAIGKDATFPDIRVSYRVHSRGSGDASEGRERTYVLPGQSIRVLSLVPGAAADIRDAPGEDFAQVESLRFRSRALQIAALGAAALGLIVLLPALVAFARRGAHAPARGPGPLPASRVLARVSRELADIATAARGGWTPELAARAANATRLAAACALDRRISHRPERDNAAVAGRLIVPIGLWRRHFASAASALTTADVRAAVAKLPLTAPAQSRETLEGLHRALSAFTTALYRPAFEPDATLDEALHSAQSAAGRLRRAHAWPRTLLRPRPASQRAEIVPQ